MKQDIRVLIVDDDAMIRECVAAFLEDEGFTVHTSSSAEEALLSIVQVDPVVCITDLRLPGMNGEHFIQHASCTSPGTHFMIHTGSAYILSDELRALGMSPDDVLLKPVHNLALLAARVSDIAAQGTMPC